MLASAFLSIKFIYYFQSSYLPPFFCIITLCRWHDRDDRDINVLKEMFDACDLIPGSEIVFLCALFILIHSGQFLSIGIIRLQADSHSFLRI